METLLICLLVFVIIVSIYGYFDRKNLVKRLKEDQIRFEKYRIPLFLPTMKRKLDIAFRIFEMVNKNGIRNGKSYIYILKTKTGIIKVNNNRMYVIYYYNNSRKQNFYFNINRLQDIDISNLKQCDLDIIKAMWHKKTRI